MVATATAAALAGLVATGAAASRDPEHRLAGRDAPPSTDDATRDALAHQLDDEAAAIERALATVTGKLGAADDVRTRRLRAAYRVLRSAPGDDAMAVARRRAAARLLLERDRGERALLADEAAQRRSAKARVAGETAQLPGLAFPAELIRPVAGPIIRRFGALIHDRSKAALSRRGVDFEVDERSPVSTPAAGTVRYAGPIRGLDQGVIVDHGTYVTVLAKLGELTTRVDAQLAAGDRIGSAARHRVYLEIRIKLGPGGQPIDPEPLLR